MSGQPLKACAAVWDHVATPRGPIFHPPLRLPLLAQHASGLRYAAAVLGLSPQAGLAVVLEELKALALVRAGLTAEEVRLLKRGAGEGLAPSSVGWGVQLHAEGAGHRNGGRCAAGYGV